MSKFTGNDDVSICVKNPVIEQKPPNKKHPKNPHVKAAEEVIFTSFRLVPIYTWTSDFPKCSFTF